MGKSESKENRGTESGATQTRLRANAEIGFKVNGQEVGRAKINREGRAELPYTVPRDLGVGVFPVNGVEVGRATTDPAGMAQIPYTVLLSAGTYLIEVTYQGSAVYEPNTASATLTVVP